MNDKFEGQQVFGSMINEIDKVQKEKIKAELKKQKLKDKNKDKNVTIDEGKNEKI